jgi:hypothetical protein
LYPQILDSIGGEGEPDSSNESRKCTNDNVNCSFGGRSQDGNQGTAVADMSEASELSAHLGEEDGEEDEELLLSPAESLASLRRRAAAEGIAMAGN